LNDEEKKNIQSRQMLIREHEFYIHMINNSIVEFLKGKVYPRLGLDVTKDYPLSEDLTQVLIEEEHAKV